MKKRYVVVLIVLAVLATSVVSYADVEELPEWFTDMIQWRKDQVNEALESEEITPAEAEQWMEHFTQMEEYHLEEGFNGFGPMNGSFGRRGFGSMFGGNRQRGFGGGCRNGWNNSYSNNF